MKRKRGRRGSSKKTKKSEASTDLPDDSPSDSNSENKQSFDRVDDSQLTSNVSVERILPDPKPEKPNVSDSASAWRDKPTVTAVYGRVKVKLKTSRLLEQVEGSSDAQAQNDMAKSKLIPNVLTGMAADKDKDHSDGKTSDARIADLDKRQKKVSSIKIKSSRISNSTTDTFQNNNADNLGAHLEANLAGSNIVANKDDDVSSSPKKALKKIFDNPRYNEKELCDALAVIKKVMKMDAAGPFNAPVDPVALGIPDYFDVIDTPMDFGTICHALEHGNKYMNSEDVYRDVQFIWENCNKYNNKGDYIMDLMKRVKKAYMKSWLAAGLYSDGADDVSMGMVASGDATVALKDKGHSKSKSKHKRKRHGFELHKSDCLCAVCVVTRRRKEREESSALDETSMDLVDKNISGHCNSKDTNVIDDPHSDTETNDEHSPVTEKYDELKGDNDEQIESSKKLDTSRPGKQEINGIDMELHEYNPTKNQLNHLLSSDTEGGDKVDHLDSINVVSTISDNKGNGQLNSDSEKEETKFPEPDDSNAFNQCHETHSETSKTSVKKEFPQLEVNHSVLPIFSRLFPSSGDSVWRGHDSLFHNAVPRRGSFVHVAVATIMKP